MASPLVECVPNFSEGRRPEVIQAIVAAIQTVPGISLLDRSSDADHNRTVVTFVGSPESVAAAAFAGISVAAKLIDMTVHQGQHPRIGATDVVPFIPIRDVSMDTCITLAKQVAQRVAQELNIPVYLYESAATRPDRENLEAIRKGEYEGLRQAIQTDPNRLPDFGPATLGSAGATVIGARPPLVAYNVYLTTGNVEIAKKIAKAMRHSTGGFRFVKAAGFLVDGKAQVSMNLTNYEKTPLARVQEAIRREADRYGVGILYAEVVGLIPENALIDAARWHLQLDLFEPTQILERKLSAAQQAAEPAALADQIGFVQAVAAGTPTPGGGAVAALLGSLSVALAEMVAQLTLGKKKYAPVEPQMQSVVSQGLSLREALLRAVDDDSHAYEAVMAAYKLDTLNPKREATIQVALTEACAIPLQVMEMALAALHLIQIVAHEGNVNAATDAAVAAYCALAAVEGAKLNVLVNAKSLLDADLAASLRLRCAKVLGEVRALHAEIVDVAEIRAGLR